MPPSNLSCPLWETEARTTLITWDSACQAFIQSNISCKNKLLVLSLLSFLMMGSVLLALGLLLMTSEQFLSFNWQLRVLVSCKYGLNYATLMSLGNIFIYAEAHLPSFCPLSLAWVFSKSYWVQVELKDGFEPDNHFVNPQLSMSGLLYGILLAALLSEQ